jgi:high-affinity iron transporter
VKSSRRKSSVALLTLLACTGASADGKKLFQTNCASCHGDKGDGKGPTAASLKTPPRNFIAGTWLKDTSENDLVQMMTDGLAASGMPSFSRLAEKDRRAIAAYLKTLKK